MLGRTPTDKVSNDGLSWLEAACGATSCLIACIFHAEVYTNLPPLSTFLFTQSALLREKYFTPVLCSSYYILCGIWLFCQLVIE